MAGFYGADTEQLRGFGDLVHNSSRRLSELTQQLSVQVHTADWVGPDADGFRDDYSGRVVGLFDNASGLMDRFRLESGEHADEQDDASTDHDGGILGPIGEMIGDFVKGVVDVATGIARGVWDFLNHPVTSGILGGIGSALDLIGGAPGGLSGALGVVGNVLAPIGIVTGVNQMLNPSHDGWRGVGDRIAGGLSVVAGVATFIPGGQIVAGIAGGIAAAWNLGNWVYDNWDGITSTVSNFASGAWNLAGDVGGAAVDFVGDVGSAAVDFAGDVGSAAVDFVGDVASGIGDFVGGLF